MNQRLLSGLLVPVVALVVAVGAIAVAAPGSGNADGADNVANSAAPASPAEQARSMAQAGEFRAAMKARAATALAKFQSTVAGRENWLFFAPELRHLGAGRWWGADAVKASQSIEPANAHPLPAILDFKAQLDRAGIRLLMLPVPPKAAIYADKLWKPEVAGKRLDPLHHEFYRLLEQNGVEVMDLSDDFQRDRDAASGPMYLRTDTHWSGRACVIAGRRIATQFAHETWLPAKKSYASAWKRVPIEGDLRAGLPKSKRGQPETVNLRFVGPARKPYTPLPEDRNSPIIVLGDSHSLVFHDGGDMHAKGAGLADQLALELGLPIDVIGVRGSGATPARVNLMRRARADKNYLSRKKLVIWCFAAREFTESLGWNVVPVLPAS